jgi:hypothetical protein
MADQLIDDYLRELRTSAWNMRLTPDQAAAAEEDVRARINSALAAAGTRDKATVHGVLDRLGPPGDIVARRTSAPASAGRRALNAVLSPAVGAQTMVRARG